MKITDSQVTLASARQYSEQNQQRERLHAWRDGAGEIEFDSETQHPGMRGLAVAAMRHQENLQRMEQRFGSATSVELSPEGAALQPQPVEVGEAAAAEMSDEERLEFLLLKALVERLSGRALELFDPNELAAVREAELPDDYHSGESSSAEGREGWGLRYDYYESHYESESLQFSAEAVVHTADGQEIRVALELNMSREYRSTESFSLRAGDALKDPLVINFDGRGVELTDRSFSFDLDADGREDQIAFVNSGSGFLALDSDGNGSIDDGSELFGALTGNGFNELSAYDEDGNGWIDESDSVYDRLRIWSKDGDGNDRLVALGERNVGAIYLGHIGTEFRLADSDNQQLGQLRSSGLYLGDDGSAGAVQQIDLVV